MGFFKIELSNDEYDRVASGLDSLPNLASIDNNPVLAINRVSCYRDITPGAGIKVYTQRPEGTEPDISLKVVSSMSTAEWLAHGLALFTYEKI